MLIENIKEGSSVYFAGIKGTGVCALAELMQNEGMKVSGSDTSEIFYTDEILKELNIPFYNGFDESHINADIDIVIHSAAYDVSTNPELAKAKKLNIPIYKYTDALGSWSARFYSAGICGVHGKTTTTALAGIFARAAGLPAQILTGSAAVDFGGRSTLSLGRKYFIAETCEYRKHFLSFRPKKIILTSVESDHQDFFPDYESIRDAFIEYCNLLPEGGELIYCADDKGASDAAKIAGNRLHLVPYGFTADGKYKITSYDVKNETAYFTIKDFGEFKIKIPGRHQALNAAAAAALIVSLAEKEFGSISEEKINSMKTALENFRSTTRRCEIIGKALPEIGEGIIFMDDYAHHPTALKTTLAGIRSFYPKRRIIASFMPHTYTRTSALLDDFAGAFNDTDILFLHKIYASAREKYTGSIDGNVLYEKTKLIHGGDVRYAQETEDAFEPLKKLLKPGDLFITLGAGNNRPLCKKLFSHFGGQND